MTNWADMTPRQRDALVAEKVMNWTQIQMFRDGSYWGIQPRISPSFQPVAPYSQNIAVAWEVMEQFERYTLNKGRTGFICMVEPFGSKNLYEGRGNTAAEAICVAALHANGVEFANR